MTAAAHAAIPRPDFDRHVLTLRFTRPARFHFNHGAVLHGLFNAVFQHDLPSGLLPFACESGRVRFEPGDFYNIGLTLIGTARSSLSKVEDELHRIGRAEPPRDRPLPTLAGNFELVNVTRLNPPDIDHAARALADRSQWTLRFVSPLRLERPEPLKTRGASHVNSACFPAYHFLRRLWTRLFFLAHDRYPTADERLGLILPIPTTVEISPRTLLWLDLPIDGRPDKESNHPSGHTVGGVVGEAILAGEPGAWLLPLVLGQYLHAGEKTHYGLGRYAIAEAASHEDGDPFRPARTAFERLTEPGVFENALSHLVSHSEAAGLDGVTPEVYSADAQVRLDALRADLESSAYSPTPLLGFLTPKDGGAIRALTIPTVRDRIVQRAACDLLAPAIDTLLEDSSYAYRKGFSRAGAARAVQRAYEDGFRWVLDADIESFFDAVDWARLFGKVHALFPFEPLCQLVEQWVMSPVLFDGRTLSRTRGLPQGAAVSPLLANLYLDELDEELLGKDYRLVRYADDFVVLCKDLEGAQRARDDAKAALAALGLALNDAKTSIQSLDQGLHYLGYLFCGSIVLDGSKDIPAIGTAEVPSIPKASWLAQLPLSRVREIARPAEGDARSRLELVALSTAMPKSAPKGRPLYVTNPLSRVELAHDAVVITSPKGSSEFPLRAISHAVFIGRVRVTVPLLLRLNEHGIPAFFCRRTGELYAAYDPHRPNWTLWSQQARKADDDSARLEFARDLVAAKIHNYATLMTRLDLGTPEDGRATGTLRELESALVNKTTLDALRGLEGKAAALYFGALARSLPEPWHFDRRRRRPPGDPVNALLSFGYTVLYNHIHTAIFTAGLHPRIGFFHEGHGVYSTLTADIQEEFRHLIDGFVIASIRRHEVKPADFAPSRDGRYPCLMSLEARRRFLEALEDRLLTEFTPPDFEEPITYRAFLDHQARHLAEWAAGRAPRYKPFRSQG